MSLRDRAKAEGVTPRFCSTITEWLDAHPEISNEILEMRAEGFSWPSLLQLVRKEYPDFTFKHPDSLRMAMVDR